MIAHRSNLALFLKECCWYRAHSFISGLWLRGTPGQGLLSCGTELKAWEAWYVSDWAAGRAVWLNTVLDHVWGSPVASLVCILSAYVALCYVECVCVTVTVCHVFLYHCLNQATVSLGDLSSLVDSPASLFSWLRTIPKQEPVALYSTILLMDVWLFLVVFFFLFTTITLQQMSFYNPSAHVQVSLCEWYQDWHAGPWGRCILKFIPTCRPGHACTSVIQKSKKQYTRYALESLLTPLS